MLCGSSYRLLVTCNHSATNLGVRGPQALVSFPHPSNAAALSCRHQHPQEVIKTNSELQSAARALADQAEMRMSDLEAQFKRRLEADQASLRAETERLKQVCVRV